MAMLFNALRAVQYMRLHNLDAMVATSAVNVTYFSGYVCWLDPLFKEYMADPGSSSNLGQPSYAVFPVTGEPALVLKSLLAVNAADLGVADLHIYGASGLDYSLCSDPCTPVEKRLLGLLRDAPHHATAAEALVAVLRQRGLTEANIGLEMEGLPATTKEAIASALPRASIKDCTNLIRLVRAVKSAEEINRLTRSAQINEQVAMESLTAAGPGRPVAELVQRYRARAAELGANFDHFAFSISGLGICTEPNHVLRSGDVLFVDFGCVYASYFSDSGTTLATKEISPVLSEKYEGIARLH